MGKMRTRQFIKGIALVSALLFLFTGCSFVFHKRSPADARKIDELESEVSRLNRELDALDAIKRNLEGRLKSEISRGEVDVEMGDRGLWASMPNPDRRWRSVETRK